MKKILCIIFACVLLASCSESFEEKQRISRAERIRLAKEDSAALKIGVLPTMDCLPLYVAKERRLFDTLGVDIRLKPYNSQIDCDAALLKGRLEGTVTDLVKGEGMKQKGTALRYATATSARWQFVANRLSRINELKQLTDKLVAMARFSATHLLTELCIDSARLKRDDVFLVQINDPNICLKMLQNNELDAMLLPEPQATSARLWKNPVLFDTEQRDIRLGVIAFREKGLQGKERSRQYAAFLKGYNAAVDSINRYGIQSYAPLVKKYMKVDEKTIRQLPKIKYTHIVAPREKDVLRAQKWL